MSLVIDIIVLVWAVCTCVWVTIRGVKSIRKFNELDEVNNDDIC